MIARRFKNDLSRKRWRRFKGQKRSWYSTWILVGLGILSLGAEFVANSKPLVLKYHGEIYFPVIRNYHPSVFGISDRMTSDYRALVLENGDYAIWPVVRWDPFETNTAVEKFPSGPTRINWFGTDDRGRDIFTRLLYGFRFSLTYALIVWVFTVCIAVTLGGTMGYFGAGVDIIGQRLVEVLSTVPTLFLLIILVSIFDPSLLLLVGFTCLFSWIGLSYYVRAEFLKNRKSEFVESARSVGAGHLRLIFIHILPNSLIPVVTFSPFIIANQILGLAGLDYLGFGLRPPTPSWGELLNQAQKNFTTAWWLAVFPSIALCSTLVMLVLVGDGVKNAFDPKKN
ncbi:MAG: ABC transporter permease subunit [Bdellovibrionota bacterium]